MLWNIRQRGQGLVEYAMIIIFVAVVIIVVLAVLGPIVGNIFTRVNSEFISRGY